jgi:D-alanine-D-alanine ligase
LRVLESYRQPALIERYLDGREFNVSVLGNDEPRVLPISEIDYSKLPPEVPRILFYEAKWMEDSPYYLETPAICPARGLSASLARKIEQIARRAFMAMGCRGYARVDMRVGRGRPYVLEVNGNPSLAPNAGLARSARQAGLTYPDLVSRILYDAMGRVHDAAHRDPEEALFEKGIL